MKRKLISTLLAFCMVLSLFSVTAFASPSFQTYETVKKGYLTYGLIHTVYYGDEVHVLECDKEATGAIKIENEVKGIPVTGIFDEAFHDCDKITSIELPDELTWETSDLFKGCTGLEKIIASTNSLNYHTSGNVLYTKPSPKSGDETIVFYCPSGQTETVFTLPESCGAIASGAFAYAKNLKAIDVYGYVGYWGENAFGYGDTLPIVIYGDEELHIKEFVERAGLTYVARAATPDSSMTASFDDVPSSSYYCDAVQWAVENDITVGTSDTTFSPDASCTRAQMVTFLWRAAGYPDACEGVNPFADVRADAYYYDAVLWAVEEGITSGTSNTTFSPNATVTRAQTVTFLYRYDETPAAADDNAFTDVAADAYYAPAVQWAVDNDITVGTSDTTFSPNNDCTRAQIVTFLYRDLAKHIL